MTTATAGRRILHDACRALAARDQDNATEQNGVGFNGRDTEFGNSLAAKPWEAWTLRMQAAALKMLRTYHVQLLNYGIDIASVPPIEDAEIQAHQQKVAAALPAPKVVKSGDRYIVSFAYGVPRFAEMLAAVKMVPGRRWDAGSKVWTVPVTADATPKLAAIAREFGWDADCVMQAAQQVQAKAQELREASHAEAAPDYEITGLGGTLRPFQVAGVRYAVAAERCFIADSMGLGKQQNVDCKVITPAGWKRIGDIVIGDEVIGSDGMPVAVRGVFPQGIKPSYRVTFSDGSGVEAGPDHLWSVDYKCGGKRWKRMVLTTQQLKDRPKLFGRDRGRPTSLDLKKTRLYLPILGHPVVFGAIESLPMPAYCLGVLIANGSLAHGSISASCNSMDVAEILVRLRIDGVHVGAMQVYGNTTRIGMPGAMIAIRSLGLDVRSGEKFIPQQYMNAPAYDRIKLLHGLMDCDGSISKTRNRVTYHTICLRLAEDVRELVEGLGGIATVRPYDRTKEGKPVEYQVRIRVPGVIVPFSISRKLSRYKPGTHSSPTRTVETVEYVGDVESVCISVNAPDQLYATEHAILTHNTVQALAAIHVKQAYPAVIVCPASLKINWRREAEKWLPGRKVAVLNGGKSALVPRDLDLYIVNYDVLGKWQEFFVNLQPAALVMDESHYTKASKSLRAQACFEIARGIPPAPRALDKAAKSRWRKAQTPNPIPMVLLLTGTPILNRPEELISQLAIMDRLKDFGGWHNFVSAYCGAYRDRFGWQTGGATHLQELNAKLRGICFIRREKADVLKELPPKQRVTVPLPIDNRKEYDEAERDVIEYVARMAAENEEFKASIMYLPADEQREAIAERRESAAYKAAQAETLVRIGTLRQVTARGKLAGMIEWVTDFVESGEKLVIFASHIEIQDGLIAAMREAKIPAVSLQGADKSEERQAAVDRFQDDINTKVIVCSIKAGGVGITLTAASNVAFAELDWTPGALDQATDRCHRIGQSDSVTAWYLLAQNTIDEWMAELIDAKRAVVDGATEGREADPGKSIYADLLARLGGRT